MTDLKKNSHALIKMVTFVSMLFFMTGIMLVAADEFDSNKYLRVIGIIPVCIALVIPYFTWNLKDYSRIILGLLSILAYSELVAPGLGFFVPCANGVMFSEMFDFLNYRMILLLIAVLIFFAFCFMFLNIKCKKVAVWALLLLNLTAVIFVLIKDPLWINRCDYYFSGSYIMLLLSVLISFDFCPKEKDDSVQNDRTWLFNTIILRCICN